MKKSILLLGLLLPLLIIPSISASSSVENWTHTGLFELIMTLNGVLAITSDMTWEQEERIAYLESLNIPDYDKQPVGIDAEITIDEDNNTVHVVYTYQTFNDISSIYLRFYDGVDEYQSGYSYSSLYSVGLHMQEKTVTLDNWASGEGTVQLSNRDGVFYEEKFQIP